MNYRSTGYSKFLVIAVTGVVAALLGQTNDVVPSRGVDHWPRMDKVPCCIEYMFLRNGVFNDFEPPYDSPIFGYPARGSLFQGVNDTSQIMVIVRNRSDADFSLASTAPESWFTPKAFMDVSSADNIYLLRDTNQLGLRLRGWYHLGYRGWRMTAFPNKVPGGLFVHDTYALCFDIWNLPLGQNCLCIDTAKISTPGFKKNQASYVYEYRTAQSLADTINAYEACYWRMIRDSNLVAAEQWTIKMLDANPNSVPGWWIRARYFLATKDSEMAKIALDKALMHLKANDDRAMPGYDGKPLMEDEKQYILWCEYSIAAERESLGP